MALIERSVGGNQPRPVYRSGRFSRRDGSSRNTRSQILRAEWSSRVSRPDRPSKLDLIRTGCRMAEDE